MNPLAIMRREPGARIVLWVWTGFGIAALLLVVLLVQNFAGVPFRKTLRRSVPDDGLGIAAHCSLPDAYRKHPWAYRFVTVYENGKPLPHWIPPDRWSAEQGNGCYQAKEGILWFVGSDGTDPRKNGREYKARGPRLVPAWALWLSLASTVVWGAGLLVWRVTRLHLLGAVRFLYDWLRSPPSCCPLENSELQNSERSLTLPDRICRWVSKYLPLVLALPSIWILTGLPPLWKNIDSVSQVTTQFAPENILHFPPFYGFMSRLLLLPGETAAWLGAGGPVPEWNLTGRLMPTDAGLYSLIIAQHAMLWLFLAQFIRSCTRSPRIQTLFAFTALTFAPFYTIASSIGSETCTMLLLLLFVSVCIRLSCESGPRYLWIAFVALLCACFLTRYINAVLAMLLPAAFAISFVLSLARGGDGSGGRLSRLAKLFAFSIVAGVIGIAVANLTQRVLCFAFEIEYRPAYGQTLADRIAPFLRRLPATGRAELEASVMRQSDDPGTREAIRSLAEIGTYYDGEGRTHEVSKLLEQSARQCWDVRDAEVYRRFNAATLLYLKTLHPQLVDAVCSDFNRGLFKSDAMELAYFPIGEHVWIFDFMQTYHDPIWRGLSRARSFNPSSRQWLESWRHKPYLRIYRNVSPAWIFAVAFIIALAAVIKNPAAVRKSGLAMALIVSGVVIFFLNMMLVYYTDRYTMPMYFLALAAVSLSVSALAEGQPSNRTG
jgi:hypothetical protein